MNNFNYIVVALVFILSYSQSAVGQTLLPQKTYTSKSAIDSVLRNLGNILGLKKGDAEPLVTLEGQMYIYSKLKTFNPNTIGRIRVYNSLKGLGYESYATGANQKLIYLTSSFTIFDEEHNKGAGSSMGEIVISGDVAKPEVLYEKNKIYNIYSTQPQPEFPGGLGKFYEFVKTNMIYPTEMNVQGKVFLEFVIEADGSITNITVPRKLGSGTDEEAVRLLKLSKKWIPGSVSGKPVRTKNIAIINFSH